MNPLWDTPPKGDFVRYIEQLHAGQAQPPAPSSPSSLSARQGASPAPMQAAPAQSSAQAAAIGANDLPAGAQQLLAQWRRLKARYAPGWLPRPLVPVAALAVLAGVLYLLWEGGGLFFIVILVAAWLNWLKLQKQKSDSQNRQARQEHIMAEALRTLQDSRQRASRRTSHRT